MKATYTLIACIVVAIIAWLLARMTAAQPKPAVLPATGTPAPATTLPADTVTVTPVAPAPVPVTNRLTLGTDGRAYNTTLPAPYNALPALSPFGGGVPDTAETRYYIWVFRNRITGTLDGQIYAGYLVGTTDAAMLDYINSIKPATRDIVFLINPSGTIIHGGF